MIDDPTADFIFARSEIREVASSRARTLAQDVINNCIQNHSQCAHYTNDPILPTRVIDCSTPERPKLVYTKGTRGAYAALSYVWGESQANSTNTRNLSAYLEGIDASCLPQTLRDAIVTTNAFGIRYLWLDSLCIIQDSGEDRIQELEQMARIYSDAYFTIIAASSRKVSDGFLQPREPMARQDPSFPLYCPMTKRLGTFYLGSDIQPDEDWDGLSVDTDPVHSRGWCLQERLLSPRALVFTSRTLQFHCQTELTNIGGADFQSVRLFKFPMYFSLSYLAEFEWKITPAPGPFIGGTPWGRYASGVLRGWRTVLKEYSRRSVTDPGDKLVAFAAIAERFYAFRRSRYLAGLWEDTLLIDLLWTTCGTPSPCRTGRYRAPTWSWAARDDNVDVYANFHFPDDVQYCKLVRSQVDLVNERLPFGAVRAGVVVLRVRMVQVILGEQIVVEHGDEGKRKLFMSRAGLEVGSRSSHGETRFVSDLLWSAQSTHGHTT